MQEMANVDRDNNTPNSYTISGTNGRFFSLPTKKIPQMKVTAATTAAAVAIAARDVACVALQLGSAARGKRARKARESSMFFLEYLPGDGTTAG